jgi:methionyl-tRNA formyltransferase
VAHGLPVGLQRELPRERKADFVVSYMYRQRVRADVLAMARRAALNFHPAPLPEFGGWAFYNVAILEGCREYGCTCHHMDEGFDTGPLLRVRRFAIDAATETAYSLERRTQEEMVRLLLEVCALAESGAPLPVEPQDPARHRYLTRDQFEMLKQIPADADAETVDRHARAFWYPPYNCAWAQIGGTRVEVMPQLAKGDLAGRLHADDLERLRAVARLAGA